MTRNYRPLKAIKYVRREDTVFEAASVPVLTYYPGDLNRRIRWENAVYSPVTREHLSGIRSHAQSSLASVVKTVKNQIKNVLSDHYVVLLFAFEKIGKIQDAYVMKDLEGNTILLEDMPNAEGSSDRLSMVTDPSLLQGQVLLGAFYYLEDQHRICVQPYSIVTSDKVVRLLY